MRSGRSSAASRPCPRWISTRRSPTRCSRSSTPSSTAYGIDVSNVAFTRITLPTALTDSLEARRLASLQLAEQAETSLLDKRRLADHAALISQEAASRRSAVEYEAAAEALRLAMLEERIGANPNAARYDLELSRIRVAEQLAGNSRAVVSLGATDLMSSLLWRGRPWSRTPLPMQPMWRKPPRRPAPKPGRPERSDDRRAGAGRVGRNGRDSRAGRGRGARCAARPRSRPGAGEFGPRCVGVRAAGPARRHRPRPRRRARAARGRDDPRARGVRPVPRARCLAHGRDPGAARCPPRHRPHRRADGRPRDRAGRGRDPRAVRRGARAPGAQVRGSPARADRAAAGPPRAVRRHEATRVPSWRSSSRSRSCRSSARWRRPCPGPVSPSSCSRSR